MQHQRRPSKVTPSGRPEPPFIAPSVNTQKQQQQPTTPRSPASKTSPKTKPKTPASVVPDFPPIKKGVDTRPSDIMKDQPQVPTPQALAATPAPTTTPSVPAVTDAPVMYPFALDTILALIVQDATLPIVNPKDMALHQKMCREVARNHMLMYKPAGSDADIFCQALLDVCCRTKSRKSAVEALVSDCNQNFADPNKPSIDGDDSLELPISPLLVIKNEGMLCTFMAIICEVLKRSGMFVPDSSKLHSISGAVESTFIDVTKTRHDYMLHNSADLVLPVNSTATGAAKGKGNGKNAHTTTKEVKKNKGVKRTRAESRATDDNVAVEDGDGGSKQQQQTPKKQPKKKRKHSNNKTKTSEVADDVAPPSPASSVGTKKTNTGKTNLLQVESVVICPPGYEPYQQPVGEKVGDSEKRLTVKNVCYALCPRKPPPLARSTDGNNNNDNSLEDEPALLPLTYDWFYATEFQRLTNNPKAEPTKKLQILKPSRVKALGLTLDPTVEMKPHRASKTINNQTIRTAADLYQHKLNKIATKTEAVSFCYQLEDDNGQLATDDGSMAVACYPKNALPLGWKGEIFATQPKVEQIEFYEFAAKNRVAMGTYWNIYPDIKTTRLPRIMILPAGEQTRLYDANNGGGDGGDDDDGGVSFDAEEGEANDNDGDNIVEPTNDDVGVGDGDGEDDEDDLFA